MSRLELQGKHYSLEEGENTLEALLRQGVKVPHGCKGGACHACLMQSPELTNIPTVAQLGLSEAQKQLGHFLSCRCTPNGNLKIEFVDRQWQKEFAEVLAIDLVGRQVLRLRLEPLLAGRAGQYINIWLDDTNIRSYSIASVAEFEDFIELHIKLRRFGKFSKRTAKHLKIGDVLTLQGPLGQCIYSATHLNQPMLLLGIGTGLAPLYGIIREALYKNHSGPIHLVLGAREAQDFYLVDELSQLCTQHPNLWVSWVALQVTNQSQVNQADIYAYVQQHFSSTKGFSIYICGASTFVQKMKKQCFLAGAKMSDLHSDAFLPCS